MKNHEKFDRLIFLSDISAASWIDGSHWATARTSSDAWWSNGKRNISFLFSSDKFARSPAVSFAEFRFTGSRLRKINGRCSSIVAGGFQQGGAPEFSFFVLRFRQGIFLLPFFYLEFRCRAAEIRRNFFLQQVELIVRAAPFHVRDHFEFYLQAENSFRFGFFFGFFLLVCWLNALTSDSK